MSLKFLSVIEVTYFHDVLGEIGQFGNVDTEALVAHPGLDLVQKSDVAISTSIFGVGDMSHDVQILDMFDLLV